MINDFISKIFMKIKNILVYTSYILFYYIFDRRKIITFLSYPQVSDNALALYLSLCREHSIGTYTYVWIVTDPIKAKELVKYEKGDIFDTIFVKESNALIARYYQLVSILNIDTHGSYKRPRIFKIGYNLCLWHGSPIKKIGRDAGEQGWTLFADILIASSKYFIPPLSSGLGIDRNKIFITGQPRNDILIGVLKTKRNFEDWNKFIIWMPTFAVSRGSPENGKGYKAKDFNLDIDDFGVIRVAELMELDNLLDFIDLKIIIKLHQYDIRNELEFSNYKNIKILKWNDARILGTGLYKALRDSLALITDFSSVMFDYMLTGKPIGIINIAPDASIRGLAFKLDFNEFRGINISSKDELYCFIKKVALYNSIENCNNNIIFNKYNDPVELNFSNNIVKILKAKKVLK